MTPLPEPMAVARLVDGNAINPGPQTGLPSEPVNRPENAKEHFLREIERLFPVSQKVARQLNNGSLVFCHQLGRRTFIARGTALHERRLAIADVRPTDDSRLFHPGSPKEWRAQRFVTRLPL